MLRKDAPEHSGIDAAPARPWLRPTVINPEIAVLHWLFDASFHQVNVAMTLHPRIMSNPIVEHDDVAIVPFVLTALDQGRVQATANGSDQQFGMRLFDDLKSWSLYSGPVCLVE